MGELLKFTLYNIVENIDVQQEQLNFAIKGDAKEQYPKVKQIMDELQKQKVNSFSLVTGLRGKNY